MCACVCMNVYSYLMLALSSLSFSSLSLSLLSLSLMATILYIGVRLKDMFSGHYNHEEFKEPGEIAGKQRWQIIRLLRPGMSGYDAWMQEFKRENSISSSNRSGTTENYNEKSFAGERTRTPSSMATERLPLEEAAVVRRTNEGAGSNVASVDKGVRDSLSDSAGSTPEELGKGTANIAGNKNTHTYTIG